MSCALRLKSNSTEKIGILGHSMASDLVVRFADDAPDVKATVAISMFSTAITPEKPPNLLVIVGSLEPSVLKAEALRAVAMQSGGPPEPGHIYGDFAAGTARRASFSDGVEHIGVLYSAETLKAARDWFNLAFGRTGMGFIDARGLWLALLFGGLVLLAYPLSRLLPIVSADPAGAGLRLRVLLPLGLVATLATPLLLWKLPTAFLPILLGDYLALHFLTFGLLMLAGWRLFGQSGFRPPTASVRLAPAILAALLAIAFGLGLFGWALDSFVVSFAPTPARLPIGLIVFICLLPFFLTEAWLTSGGKHAIAAGVLMKLCFLVSLGIAVGSQPAETVFSDHHHSGDADRIRDLRAVQPLDQASHRPPGDRRDDERCRDRLCDQRHFPDGDALRIRIGDARSGR